MLTGSQIRAARAFLDWTVNDAASHSNVSPATIKRLERQAGVPASHGRTLLDLKRAFEEAGVEFIGTPEQPGVILKGISPPQV